MERAPGTALPLVNCTDWPIAGRGRTAHSRNNVPHPDFPYDTLGLTIRKDISAIDYRAIAPSIFPSERLLCGIHFLSLTVTAKELKYMRRLLTFVASYRAYRLRSLL